MKYPVNVLRCPITKGTLDNKGRSLYSHQGRFEYPHLNEIPWLFKDHGTLLNQWRSRGRFWLNDMSRKINQLKTELAHPETPGITHARLRRLIDAYTHNSLRVAEVLKPLGIDDKTPPSLLGFTGDKVPATQIMNSYMDTLFRDWSWDNGEADVHRKNVIELLPLGHKWGKILVIGSGSGRLAYDIHNRVDNEFVMAMDINPFLMLIAQRMYQQNPLELYEIPMSPLSQDGAAVKLRLISPTLPKEGLFLLFGDGLNPPFKNASFDTVVTPWFIDIIPMDILDLSKNISRILRPKGQWLNFGPLGFDKRSFWQNYAPEEIRTMVSKNGFEMNTWSEDNIPYMQSPYSGHGRMEKTWSFCATKSYDQAEPSEYRYIPDWITDTSKPIPTFPLMEDETFRHRIHYQILGSINGQISVDQLVQGVSQTFNMTPELAKESVINMLVVLYERAQKKI